MIFADDLVLLAMMIYNLNIITTKNNVKILTEEMRILAFQEMESIVSKICIDSRIL
jgi:hypothetical protein